MTRYDRVFNQMRNIVNFGRTCNYTLNKIESNWLSLLNSEDMRKLTKADRGYIKGWFDCELNRIWQYEVEFCYIIDGVQHGTSKDSIFPRAPHKDLSCCERAHYWKGTNKLFTELKTS